MIYNKWYWSHTSAHKHALFTHTNPLTRSKATSFCLVVYRPRDNSNEIESVVTRFAVHDALMTRKRLDRILVNAILLYASKVPLSLLID